MGGEGGVVSAAVRPAAGFAGLLALGGAETQGRTPESLGTSGGALPAAAAGSRLRGTDSPRSWSPQRALTVGPPLSHPPQFIVEPKYLNSRVISAYWFLPVLCHSTLSKRVFLGILL